MTPVEWLIAVTGAALGTYALRAAPLLCQPLREIGRRYVNFLTLVSFAIAGGIVSKALIMDAGAIATGPDTVIKFAGVAAALGFYRLRRNVPVALFIGAAFAVLMKWLIGA
jgi:branched-subunit amino acid transport protein